MASSSSSEPESHPFPLAPPPWNGMKATGYLFLTHSSASTPLPPGSYDPLEADSPFASAETGTFTGGFGSVTILRYKDSPVGPYDELFFIPGYFSLPPSVGGGSKLRITRIYVSSAASTYNGRRNWGIAKKVARFRFVGDEDGGMCSRVELREAGDGDDAKPFFAVDLKPAVWGVTMPLSTAFSPIDLAVVHPPLPRGAEVERTASDKWYGVNPYVRGTGGGAWAKGALGDGEWADGVAFPKVQPVRLGVWWKDATIDFSEGEVLGEENRKDI
ncbi:hypothetical protein BZA05DRAFT_366411 [Tricharina praecox]|uniref:uncharacterized protein n=1 Tax=Tricharina praecox TaxID=43433 RepID=UPI00221E4EDB|nr:uncharacterized protein BZA05DRAFT_366411 [Tricharina praecox]KAI5858858.1 hypothetical protein BZA05DRAFT_366411 [Tricharina praecox]